MTTQMSSPKATLGAVIERSFGLDFIRALAISLVLIAHFAKKFEHVGFWGVEMFFALSGYLIGGILWRSVSSTRNWNTSNLINFWSRRWWRTLPNYYLFLIIMVVYHGQFGGHPTLNQFGRFLWFGQDLLTRDGGFYGVSWSLCIEEWFYLLFPLALLLFLRFRITPRLAFCLTLILFVIVSFAIRTALVLAGDGHALRCITFARLDSIACGVGTAFVFASTQSLGLLRRKLVAFGLGAILLLVAIRYLYFAGYDYKEANGSVGILFIAPLAFALLLPALEGISYSARPSVLAKIVKSLSLWSYSIYLSHIPIMFITYTLLDAVRDSTLGNMFSKAIGAAVTITVSALIYRYFEIPITRLRPRELRGAVD